MIVIDIVKMIIDFIVIDSVVGVVELGSGLNRSVKSTEPVRSLKLGIPLPICKNGCPSAISKVLLKSLIKI